MTNLMEKALAAMRRWPAERQDEAAEILLALDRLGPDVYHASPAELIGIDEALADVAAGELSSDEDVEAAFARFRK